MPLCEIARGMLPPNPTVASPCMMTRGGPLLALGIVSASTHAYTTCELLGAIASPMRPFVPLGKPLPVISFHVLPPSVVFHSAEPGPPLSSEYGVRFRSQLDAYSTSGFDGSM